MRYGMSQRETGTLKRLWSPHVIVAMCATARVALQYWLIGLKGATASGSIWRVHRKCGPSTQFRHGPYVQNGLLAKDITPAADSTVPDANPRTRSRESVGQPAREFRELRGLVRLHGLGRRLRRYEKVTNRDGGAVRRGGDSAATALSCALGCCRGGGV
nr:hypothetical protein Iba_chr05cCG14870 [Ipomoea batatas]